MNKAEQINLLKKLYKLASNTKKHSSYQLLPDELRALFKKNDISEKTHYERERLAYFLKHFNPKNKQILDIGGNTGYFSFEFINKGAKRVDCYEGGEIHAEFLSIASEILKVRNKFNLWPEYFNFENDLNVNYNLILLLNVLHHVGDDFGNSSMSKDQAKSKIIEKLNCLSSKTNMLIFQMGFNWKGNIKQCLFDNGTKLEMIKFIKKGVKNNWEIRDIGIAERNNEIVKYTPVNENNIKRDDSLGEFLNRPIFILETKHQII